MNNAQQRGGNKEVQNTWTLKLVGEMGGQSKAATRNLQPSMLSLAEKLELGSNRYLQNIRKAQLSAQRFYIDSTWKHAKDQRIMKETPRDRGWFWLFGHCFWLPFIWGSLSYLYLGIHMLSSLRWIELLHWTPHFWVIGVMTLFLCYIMCL